MIRTALLALATLPLCGCLAAVAGVEGTSVAVFGRGVADIGVSAITGKDCSIVRLDQGQDYCAPRQHLPAPPLFCTKTLGDVQCWSNPEAFLSPPHEVADTPSMTPEQARQVTARWPKSLNLGE